MFRVTSQLSTRFALREIRKQSANAALAQLQLSTGKRVVKPSDDPIAFRSASSLRAEVRRLDSEIRNIDAARGTLNMSVTRLTDARSLITRAQTAAQQGRDEQHRATHADTIDSLLEHLVSLANDQSEGRYVFGGASPLEPPATVQRDATGAITSVHLSGSTRPLQVPIGESFAVETSLPAADVFGDTGRGALQIVSRTGAAAGSGADSARGSGTIQVRRTSTSYAAGSGVAAGASSDQDTVVGPAGAHVLTIVDTSGTGAFGQVSLNGAAPVEFTSSDTDLRVTGPDGQQVHLDMSAIVPGFNGDVDITADGTISIDGGLTTVPIDFSSNQQLVHGETGETVNVDTTGVRTTGDDPFEHPGGADLFDVLITLRDDLRGDRGLSEAEFQQALSRHLDELDRLTDHLIDGIGEQAVALENLDTAQALSEDIRLEAQVSISRAEDADISQAVLALQSAQMVLQTTYAATSQIFQSSLLDFI